MTNHWEELMAKASLDFCRGFLDVIVAGRRDYAWMTEVTTQSFGHDGAERLNI